VAVARQLEHRRSVGRPESAGNRDERVVRSFDRGEEVDRWALAGDQLYVDLDLSVEHLPPGARLSIGDAVLEVSEKPHTGCAKFSARFGVDALRLVGSP